MNMKIDMYQILAAGVLVNFLSHWFGPVQWVKEKTRIAWLLEKVFRYPIMDCSKCLGFWITLAITWNPLSAALVSFTAYVIEHIIDRIQAWYEE